MQLRKGRTVSWPATTVPAGVRMPLEGLRGAALDMEVVLERGTSLISGITIESWSSNQGSAAVLYDWEASQLEVRNGARLALQSRCNRASPRCCPQLHGRRRELCLETV